MTQRKREEYESALLTVRFTGKNLETSGVSIYDLGTSLLMIQRLLNKAHLCMEGNLKKGAYPDKKDREMLSLQIGERRRQSDAFALVPVLADGITLNYLKTVADYVASGISGYYTGQVLKKINGENDENKKIYIGAIHADVVNIVNRIDASGGIDGIHIGSPALKKETVASFNAGSRDYVASLVNEHYLGRAQTIKGNVYRLYPSSLIATIRRAGGRKVDIYLSEENFDKIRYGTGTDPLVSFTGRPRHKFGIESQQFDEFNAESISIE